MVIELSSTPMFQNDEIKKQAKEPSFGPEKTWESDLGSRMTCSIKTS